MNRKLKNNSLLLALLLLLSSCFKEDEIVVPQKPGNVETVTIEMLPDYTLQAYFSFSAGGIVSSNERSEYDLLLSTEPGNYTLRLNTSLFMYAAHTGVYDFNEPLTTQGREWLFDQSSGIPDSNAIGTWWKYEAGRYTGTGEVLLIDRGIDAEGMPRGYLKILPGIDPLTGNVNLRIARPDGSQEREFTIHRETSRRFVSVSFDKGVNNPQIEPPSIEWDLHFTTYTTLLFTNTGEPYPYLVNGVLLNDTLVKAIPDTSYSFGEITREIAENLQLSARRDIIGYNWKEINGDVTSGNITYTARPGLSYVIRDSRGILYKLRFIDFYNNQGKKGYPKFEYQRL